MDLQSLLPRIAGQIQRFPKDAAAYDDYFSAIIDYCKQTDTEESCADYRLAHESAKTLLSKAKKQLEIAGTHEDRKKFYDVYRKSMRFDARYTFDSYLQYVEIDRRKEERFYLPRRHYLLRYVDAYQEILDGELDFLSVSMPKRSGKSQLGINFISMLSGLRPNGSTLMEGTGDALVKSFYTGCLEYLERPSEYLYDEVFPESKVVQTDGDIKIINLVKKSRFPTIMCRPIDASQVGLSEATNLLYLDDMVAGRPEAKNRDRMDAKWETVSGDIIGRAIEGTPIVSCGTRYSIYDPMGRLIDEMKKQGKRMKVIETPALDPVTDESNFEYIRKGKRVFTTAYFRHQREMLLAEQFESEFQQQPFEAKGLMFPESQLKRYFELPVDIEPDVIMCVCDTAEKGDDFCAMPIAAIYGADVYIIDVVFDDSPPTVVKPECAQKIIENKVSAGVFESNNAGEYFARDIDTILKEKEYKFNLKTKRTITNKHTRIEFASVGVLENFYFKDKSLYSPASQYGQFMRQLTTYTRTGKVSHDDAPDSISLLENEIRNLNKAEAVVFRRTF